jgi:hypothetical protein
MLEEVVNPAEVDAFRLEEMYEYCLGTAASDSSGTCYAEMKHRLGPNNIAALHKNMSHMWLVRTISLLARKYRRQHPCLNQSPHFDS